MAVAKRGRFQDVPSSSEDDDEVERDHENEVDEEDEENEEDEVDEENEEDEEDEEDEEKEEEKEEQYEEEEEDVEGNNFDMLSSLVTKGKIDTLEPEAIQNLMTGLTMGELIKLKEKFGTKKFYEMRSGQKKVKADKNATYTRANKNRPREMSAKNRKIEPKVVIQVAKVFRNDPRFDPLCGEFDEKKFNKHYAFINDMRVEEVEKLKEELKEETNPRRIDKIKYLIQRMENQIRSEKKRREEESQQQEEKQVQIDAMNEGKSPYFATKAVKRDQTMRTKFNKLKEDGKLEQYMAKKRKHNSQRDKKHFLVKKT